VPLIRSNGLILNVFELGEGPPVVMLHGLLAGSSASWYFTSGPSLAGERHLLLYDLRGHGRSSRASTGYDTATMVQDLAGLLDGMGWKEPVTLIGHSYGALVALRFALAWPARVGKLALVEAPLSPSRLPDLQAFFTLGPERMAEALPLAMKNFLDRRGRQAEKLLASLAHLVFETSLLEDVRREQPPTDEELARLRKPLLVYGDASACREDGERMARIIPGARLVMLPGGHYIHLDATDALTSTLREYLRG
jgi:pimeloyl-ACP methyl ester carboxylesterase